MFPSGHVRDIFGVRTQVFWFGASGIGIVNISLEFSLDTLRTESEVVNYGTKQEFA